MPSAAPAGSREAPAPPGAGGSVHSGRGAQSGNGAAGKGAEPNGCRATAAAASPAVSGRAGSSGRGAAAATAVPAVNGTSGRAKPSLRGAAVAAAAPAGSVHSVPSGRAVPSGRGGVGDAIALVERLEIQGGASLGAAGGRGVGGPFLRQATGPSSGLRTGALPQPAASAASASQQHLRQKLEDELTCPVTQVCRLCRSFLSPAVVFSELQTVCISP